MHAVMAGMMQWFQVTCPNCTGALQVRLPEGVTAVQCSQCKAVFAVQVQPIALSTSAQQPPMKRSRKRKSVDKNAAAAGSSGEPPRTLSAYNVFMKGEVAKVKGEHPELPHREAFKLAAERWQASPMNPQNGGERFPLKASQSMPLEAAGSGFDGAEEGAEEDGIGLPAGAEYDGEEGDEEDGEEDGYGCEDDGA